MQNLFTPRARRTDPKTSKDAARRAARFAASHAGMILAAIVASPGITALQIADRIGLHKSQVNKRTGELAAEGMIERNGEYEGFLRCWPTDAGLARVGGAK